MLTLQTIARQYMQGGCEHCRFLALTPQAPQVLVQSDQADHPVQDPLPPDVELLPVEVTEVVVVAAVLVVVVVVVVVANDVDDDDDEVGEEEECLTPVDTVECVDLVECTTGTGVDVC